MAIVRHRKKTHLYSQSVTSEPTVCVVLTYKIQGREGALKDRTQWNRFGFNPELASHNAFSIRCQRETLRILHEDEVHFTKLVYLPTKDDYVPASIEEGSNTESSTIVDNISNKKGNPFYVKDGSKHVFPYFLPPPPYLKMFQFWNLSTTGYDLIFF